MRYRQNTKGDILYGPPVIAFFLEMLVIQPFQTPSSNIFIRKTSSQEFSF